MEIEIDDLTLQQYIEHYAERLMERQINHYIQFKLKGVIEARLAALRLSDPSFPSLDNHITEQLGAMVDAKVREILPALAYAEIKNSMQQIVSNIR